MTSLALKSIAGLAQLAVIIGLCLFLPAWTLRYWQGWLFLIIFVACSSLVTAYLWKRDPALLQRRVSAGPAAEKEQSQKVIQLFASAAFLGILVVPALDHRFGWSRVPLAAVAAGDVLVAIGFAIVFLVFRENTFTSATIEVSPEQRTISTGSYAIVRHPMYAGALIMLIGAPLALGSMWGLAMVAMMIAVIVWRLLDEEKFLSRNLEGYTSYRERVRYRLLPGVW
jgi:protein-S-isoprenylcysteine O-methyltransferase Ste14